MARDVVHFNGMKRKFWTEVDGFVLFSIEMVKEVAECVEFKFQSQPLMSKYSFRKHPKHPFIAISHS